MVESCELPPDPRLGSPSTYSRQETVSALEEFYDFFVTLPHIDPTKVHRAPTEGWPEISVESLASWGVTRSAEVIKLLRRLPYVDGEMTKQYQWIRPGSFPCDWRLVGAYKSYWAKQTPPRAPPIWIKREGDSWKHRCWPDWVVPLTAGTGPEEWVLLLDTMDGTVTRWCAYEGAERVMYGPEDPRKWRDDCEEDTAPVREYLARMRQKFVDMEWLGIPNSRSDGIRAAWIPASPLDQPQCYWIDSETGERCDSPEDASDLEEEKEEDGERTLGCWIEGTEELGRIYKEHGWPDHLKRAECRQELLEWKRRQPDYFKDEDYDS